MQLELARNLANQVVAKLNPYCRRIEIAGSIRRNKTMVRDIDLVLIPSDPWNLQHEIVGLGVLDKNGSKLKRLQLPQGAFVDMYLCDESTWATVLLIRTGSKEHNVYLCSLAKDKGMVLHADGRGLAKVTPLREEPIHCTTEQEIFSTLGLPYKEPWQRI